MRRGYLWGLAGIIVIAAIVIYAVAHHSSYNSKASNGTYSSTASNSNKPAASTNQIITTKTSPSLGQYLADGNGRTLYTYDQDKTGASNVSGSLLSSWPAYTATSTQASLPANVSTITRSDGTVQYTYNGMPLYYFAGEPTGQVTGDGVSGFHVAKPAATTQSQSSTPTNSAGSGSPY